MTDPFTNLSPMHGVTRRQFLSRVGAGVGGMALASLLNEQGVLAQETPHHAPRARRVIYLHMAG